MVAALATLGLCLIFLLVSPGSTEVLGRRAAPKAQAAPSIPMSRAKAAPQIGAKARAAFRLTLPRIAPLPRPRPRPPQIARPQPPAAPPAWPSLPQISPAPAPPQQASTCRARLDGLAVAPSLPAIEGPGSCGTADAVRLEAILTRAARRILVQPPAVLDCAAAEAFAQWVRDDVIAALPASGPQLTGISVAAAYECRPRNRVVGAQMSQHGLGQAIDIRAFLLANHAELVLTDTAANMAVRQALRETGCKRFTTVLGPGSDGYHEAHVHFDIIQRRSGYRLCQWDVR